MAEDHSTFAASGAYSASNLSGTTAESGFADSFAEQTLDYSYGGAAGSSWVVTAGSAHSWGSGGYSTWYSGNGSNDSSTATTAPEGTLTLSESWQEAGAQDSGYDWDTTSSYAGSGWVTTGTAHRSGSGSGLSAYSATATTAYSYASGDSLASAAGSGGSVGSASQQSDWTYRYQSTATLASNGTVSTSTSASASGNHFGDWTYFASGAGESFSESSGYASGDGTYSETHTSYTQERSQGYSTQCIYSVLGNSCPGSAVTTA